MNVELRSQLQAIVERRACELDDVESIGNKLVGILKALPDEMDTEKELITQAKKRFFRALQDVGAICAALQSMSPVYFRASLQTYEIAVSKLHKGFAFAQTIDPQAQIADIQEQLLPEGFFQFFVRHNIGRKYKQEEIETVMQNSAKEDQLVLGMIPGRYGDGWEWFMCKKESDRVVPFSIDLKDKQFIQDLLQQKDDFLTPEQFAALSVPTSAKLILSK